MPIKRIHIFKYGSHTDRNGVVVNFSDSTLQEVASSYDVAKNEAPIVAGKLVSLTDACAQSN